MSKLLVADIGNTNIVLAVYDKGWISFNRVKSKENDVFQKVSEQLKELKFEHAVVSSVVPKLTDVVCNAIKEQSVEPLLVSKKLKTGLDNSSLPDELGSDILCNLIAAHSYYPDSYVTVADFGTAFTTSTVNPKGQLMGVTISPGMMTSVKALFQNTAQLPQIKLDLPETVLGLNTIDSIRAGVLYGFVGQVEQIVAEIEKELGTEVKLVLTGGLSRYVKPYIKKTSVSNIKFTVDGARIFYDMNAKHESE